MRATLETIEQIEKYLMNEMSSADKMAFETEINSDPTLKSQVEMQQQLVEGIQRMGLKASAKSARKKYQIRKWSIRIAIAVGVIGAGLAAAYFISNSNAANEQNGSGDAAEEYDSKVQNIMLDDNDSLYLENNDALKQEFFEINQDRDTVIESEEGIVVFVPANSFDTDNRDIDFLLQSALNPEDILAANLDTKTLGGDTLETGGMFYLDAFSDGKRVELLNELVVDIPANPEKTGMQLYEGVQDENGDLVWTNPAELKKPLIPVEITELDFYPPGYESWMNNRGHENKEFKDSLYYSFAFDDADVQYNNLRQEELNEIESGSSNPFLMMMLFPKLPQDTVSLQSLGSGLMETEEEILNWSMTVNEISQNEYDVYFEAFRKGMAGYFAYPINHDNWKVDRDVVFENKQNISQISNIKNHDFGFSLNIKTNGPLSTSVVIKHKIGKNVGGEKMYFKPLKKTFRLKLGSNLLDEVPQLGVDPASIKAIWNKKFNETNLATKEFEERIPFIHASCENKILELYIQNLNLNISEVDEMAYQMGGGSKFKEFAALDQGKVDMSSAHSKMLNDYYKTKRDAVRKAIAQINNSYWDEQNKLDAAYEKSKSESDLRNRDAKRATTKKEIEFNTDRVYKDLGMKKDPRRNPRIQTRRSQRNTNRDLAENSSMVQNPPRAPQLIPTQPQRNVLRGTVRTLGWRNVDCLYGLAQERESVIIKGNGRQSKVTYEPWEIKISNEDEMDEVRVYNIPKQFNTYVKLKKGTKGYSHKLNKDLDYQTVALGWNVTGVYFYTESTKPGTEEVSLEKSEGDDWKEKLKNLLPRINGIQKEIDFADYTRKDITRKNTNKFKSSLRAKVERVIFPCRITEFTSNEKIDDKVNVNNNMNTDQILSVVAEAPKNCDVPPTVPSAFSPNNDSKNDFFFITLACEPYKFEITIKDTYSTVYHSKDPNFKWGSSDLFGKLMVKDQYFYTINYNDDIRSLPGWDHTYEGRVRVVL